MGGLLVWGCEADDKKFDHRFLDLRDSEAR